MKWRVLFFLLAAAVAGAGADAATLSLKVFDRIAKDVELAYIRAGTSEIVRVPMERVMFGVWQADVPVAKGDYEYRFVVDGEWMSDISNWEINRWDDGSVWSRIPVKGDDDVVANYRVPEPKTPDVGVWTPAVESGDVVAPPEAEPGKVVSTFRFYSPRAKDVALVGTFNDWNGAANPMHLRDGVWECSLLLAPGTYEYKFKADHGWYWDLDRPPEKYDGNSVIEISEAPVAPEGVMIDPAEWAEKKQILLEPATGVHAFQQELLRAYIYIIGQERYHLKIADGSLLNPDNVPMNPKARWGWTTAAPAGLTTMFLSVETNRAGFELRHPLTRAPRDWLNDYRGYAAQIFPDVALEFSGPAKPPANSCWSIAHEMLAEGGPLSDVVAVNEMTHFGRNEGWSRELMRELAVTYADMSADHRYRGIGGWAPNVFAARAVVYADLAREAGAEVDETLAYVLARIGRPDDGAAFLPEEPETLRGKLAAAIAAEDPSLLIKWTGTPDHYKLGAPAGYASVPPDLGAFTREEKALIFSVLSDILFRDEQVNSARCYLDEAIRLKPDLFSLRMRALTRGSVSAGHRHGLTALSLAADPELWRDHLDDTGFQSGADEGGRALRGGRDRLDALAPKISAVASIYQEKNQTLLDTVGEAIPASVRLLLLRDMLNVAWWQSSRFYGLQYGSESGARQLAQVMAPWAPSQPEMQAFAQYNLKWATREKMNSDIRRNFIKRKRKPDTMAFIRLTRLTFGTWLMDEAQRMYPLVPTVQSDLLPDYEDNDSEIYYQGREHLRANARRLAAKSPLGYPLPGALPTAENPRGVPASVFDRSFSLDRRLAREWEQAFDRESQDAAAHFYERSIAVAPLEISTHHSFAKLLMSNGRYQDVIKLAGTTPDSMEGLERAGMERMGTYAALEQGDIKRALDFSGSAAGTWQATSMSLYSYVLEIAGDTALARSIKKSQRERYQSKADIYQLIRLKADTVDSEAKQLFDWIEQFDDLERASKEGRIDFSQLKSHPFVYMALGRWDRALWLLKPLAEAVQNDYIWFALMTVGQQTGDTDARNLGEHVLANHVFNAWGDFARFMRKQTTWEEVLNAARRGDVPQPMYCLAAILAEQRGDVALARRLYTHTLDPRFTVGPWFTMGWQAVDRLGGDALVFVRHGYEEAPHAEEDSADDELLPD